MSYLSFLALFACTVALAATPLYAAAHGGHASGRDHELVIQERCEKEYSGDADKLRACIEDRGDYNRVVEEDSKTPASGEALPEDKE